MNLMSLKPALVKTKLSKLKNGFWRFLMRQQALVLFETANYVFYKTVMPC